jgi:hypothetical protein
MALPARISPMKYRDHPAGTFVSFPSRRSASRQTLSYIRGSRIITDLRDVQAKRLHIPMAPRTMM